MDIIFISMFGKVRQGTILKIKYCKNRPKISHSLENDP